MTAQLAAFAIIAWLCIVAAGQCIIDAFRSHR